jgi:hypothetical protein
MYLNVMDKCHDNRTSRIFPNFYVDALLYFPFSPIMGAPFLMAFDPKIRVVDLLMASLYILPVVLLIYTVCVFFIYRGEMKQIGSFRIPFLNYAVVVSDYFHRKDIGVCLGFGFDDNFNPDNGICLAEIQKNVESWKTLSGEGFILKGKEDIGRIIKTPYGLKLKVKDLILPNDPRYDKSGMGSYVHVGLIGFKFLGCWFKV